MYDSIVKSIALVNESAGSVVNIALSKNYASLAIIRFNAENQFKHRLEVYKVK